MEIHNGIQPNCSELVIYLDDKKENDIFKKLRENGIEYCYVDNFNSFENEKQSDWDSNQPTNGSRPIREFSKVIQNALKKYFDSYDESKAWIKAEKLLKKNGFNLKTGSLQLIDESNVHKSDYGSSINYYSKFGDGKPAIVGNQHCQASMFPTLKKISDLFGLDVESYDGGSLLYYEKWLSDGCPDPKTWNSEEE